MLFDSPQWVFIPSAAPVVFVKSIAITINVLSAAYSTINKYITLLTKITAAQNQAALSYQSARVIFSGSCFYGDYSKSKFLFLC